MNNTNISILYFSPTGNTNQMAECIKEGAELVAGVTAKTMSLTDIDETFLSNSSCVLIGTPTYYTGMASEVKTWLDKQSGKYDLKGKLGGAFATAAYIHGGADMAIQGVLTHLMFSGMMIYSGGGACGEPPIHLGPVAIDDDLDHYTELFRTYGKRMAEQAKELTL